MPEKGTKALKEILKKNQLMISALATMIAVAGYLQFAENELGNEAYLTEGENTQVTNGDAVENLTSEDMTGTYDLLGLLDLSEEDLELADIGIQDIESMDTDIETPAEGEIPGDAVFTSGLGVIDMSEVRLMKEQTRAKNRETLLEIINSAGLTDVQKQNAVDTMVRMTQIA